MHALAMHTYHALSQSFAQKGCPHTVQGRFVKQTPGGGKGWKASTEETGGMGGDTAGKPVKCAKMSIVTPPAGDKAKGRVNLY